MKIPDLKTFSYDIIRHQRKEELNHDFPEADAFQKICYDLLKPEYSKQIEPYKLFPFSTERRDGGVDFSGEDDEGLKRLEPLLTPGKPMRYADFLYSEKLPSR